MKMTVRICFQLEQTLNSSLRSNDELFHVALYEWMLSKEMTERLLEVPDPILLRFTNVLFVIPVACYSSLIV